MTCDEQQRRARANDTYLSKQNEWMHAGLVWPSPLPLLPTRHQEVARARRWCLVLNNCTGMCVRQLLSTTLWIPVVGANYQEIANKEPWARSAHHLDVTSCILISWSARGASKKGVSTVAYVRWQNLESLSILACELCCGLTHKPGDFHGDLMLTLISHAPGMRCWCRVYKLVSETSLNPSAIPEPTNHQVLSIMRSGVCDILGKMYGDYCPWLCTISTPASCLVLAWRC